MLVQANILWSYATLHYMPQGDLLNIVAAHVLENLEQFSPQNLSNTVWALATLQSLHKVDAKSYCIYCLTLPFKILSRHGTPEI